MTPEFLSLYADHRGITVEQAVEEIVAIINEVAGKIANRFTFGYHQRRDIIQQCHLEAYEAFAQGCYDHTRPLKNYLFFHLRNRLGNLKRGQFFRSEAPCDCCDPFDPGPQPCVKWVAWNNRNLSKQRLMNLLPLDDVELAATNEDHGDFQTAQLREFVLGQLSEGERGDFLALERGGVVSRHRRALLLKRLRSILENGDGEAD